MNKRIFSLLLAFVLLFAAAPIGAFADDITWDVTGTGVLKITGSGPMPDYKNSTSSPWFSKRNSIVSIEIDDNITYIGNYAFSGLNYAESIKLPKKLTEIGTGAFTECKKLRFVTLPSGVTELGVNAFRGCTALNHVTFNEGLKKICDSAFALCGLYSADLPSTLVTIGNSAFSSTHLSEIIIPENVTYIGENAFSGCSKARCVYIPASVTHIGELAFRLGSIQSIQVSTANPNYASDSEGALFTKDMSTLIRYPSGRLSNSYTVPEGVTRIEEYAFEGSGNLSSLTLPDTLVSIGYEAFGSCQLLKHLAFPGSVQQISGFYYSPNQYSGSTYKLTSAVFEGDAPSDIQPADAESPSFDPGTVTVYYFTNSSGWTYPQWKGYNTCPVLSGSSNIFVNGYNEKLNQYFFRFTDNNGEPVTNVTVTVDGASISSGEESTINFAAIAGASSTITISCEGYYEATLPFALFDYFNDFTLYPLSYKEPFVQAAFIKKNNQSRPIDLLFEGAILHKGEFKEQTSIYLDINWAGNKEGSVYAGQTLDPADGMQLYEGYNAEKNYSVFLTPGKDVYMLMQTGGKVYHRKLPISVVNTYTEVPLDMGDDLDFEVPNDAELINQFSLSMDVFDNLKISAVVEKDGSVKGVVGFELEDDAEVSKTLYNTVKDAFNDASAQKYGNSVSTVKGLINRITKGGPFELMRPPYKKWVIDGDWNIIGYFTGVLEEDSSGELYVDFKEFKIGIAFNGQASKTWQQMAPGNIPFYIGGEIGGGFELIPTLRNEDGWQLYVIPMDVKADFGIKIRGGLGWDSIASVGMYGKGGLELNGIIPVSEDGVTLVANATFGAEAKFFCLSADFEIAKTKDLYLIGEAKAPAKSIEEFDIINEIDWQPQQRDYLIEQPLLLVEGEETQSGTTLFENIYPYSDLQYGVAKNGTQYLVWTADDGSRTEANNRTSLYYAYNTGSGWSKAKRIDSTDDLTADFNPVLYINQNEVYVAWQNASRPLTADDTVQSTAQAMDISIAQLVSQRVYHLGTVGTGYYDGAVSMTLDEAGDPCVVWVSNSSENILSSQGNTCSLHKAVIKDGEITQQTLATGLGCIDQTACDGELIWFAMDTDYDGTTLADREVYCYDGTLYPLTDNNTAETAVAFTDGVNWYENGTVNTPSGYAPLLENTDVYKYLKSAQGLDCVVYTVTGNDRISSLYASFNDGSGWGEPILIEGGNGSIGSFDADFLPDGSLNIAVCERTVSADLSLSAGAKLRYYTVTPKNDLCIDGLSYEASTLIRGGELSVQAELINKGFTGVKMIEMSAYDGQTLLDSGVLLFELDSGCSDTIIFPVKLGDTLPENLIININAVGFDDAASEDNIFTLELNHSDISLEEARVWSDADSSMLTVLAANRGAADLEGFDLNIADEEGNVLACKENINIPEGESEYITVTIDTPIENGAIIYFSAAAPEGINENILANNEVFACTVSSVKNEGPAANISFTDAATGFKVIAELENSPFGSESCTLYCALYDKDGKMLSLRSAVYDGSDEIMQFSHPFQNDNVKKIKLFAIGKNCTPEAEHILVNI